MPIITISSQFGAGGPAVGKQLAERLGVDYVDKEIIHQIALGLDVTEDKVAEFDEARHSRLHGFLSTVFDFDALKKKATPATEQPPAKYDDREEIPYNFQVKGWIDRDIYRQMILKVMTAVGERGGAVIKGRGSQWILKDNPRAIHVRFVADRDDRVARTVERRKISKREAEKLIDEMDQRGGDYVKTYFECDLTDSSLYHLVLNSSRIPLDTCLEMLERLARKLVPADG